MEEVKPLVVKGVYSPEAYKEALSKAELSLDKNQKNAVKQLSMALGISASDIIKAILYFVYDRSLIITNHHRHDKAL
jgi:hypothetical protein